MCSHHIHRILLYSSHVGANHRGRKQRQILKRISMSGFGTLNAAQSSLVETLLTDFGKGSAARVGVVETAVGATVDESGAVHLRDEG